MIVIWYLSRYIHRSYVCTIDMSCSRVGISHTEHGPSSSSQPCLRFCNQPPNQLPAEWGLCFLHCDDCMISCWHRHRHNYHPSNRMIFYWGFCVTVHNNASRDILLQRRMDFLLSCLGNILWMGNGTNRPLFFGNVHWWRKKSNSSWITLNLLRCLKTVLHPWHWLISWLHLFPRKGL